MQDHVQYQPEVSSGTKYEDCAECQLLKLLETPEFIQVHLNCLSKDFEQVTSFENNGKAHVDIAEVWRALMSWLETRFQEQRLRLRLLEQARDSGTDDFGNALPLKDASQRQIHRHDQVERAVGRFTQGDDLLSVESSSKQFNGCRKWFTC